MSVRIWAYLGIVIALLGGSRYAYLAVYDAGYNAAVVEVRDQYQDAKDKAIKARDDYWQELVDQAEGQIVVETEYVEVEKIIEKEIPVVVEKIVTVKPECRDLGPDVSGLLTAQALALPGAGSTDPGIAADTD